MVKKRDWSRRPRGRINREVTPLFGIIIWSLVGVHLSQVFFRAWKTPSTTLLWSCLEELWSTNFNHYWSSLPICWHLLEITLVVGWHTTIYVGIDTHTYGYTEVVNHMLIHLIHMYKHMYHRTWDANFPYIQHIYGWA